MGTEQQPGVNLEIDMLGKKLSLAINCPVTLTWDKPVLECHHGIHFMKWLVVE